jgi:hypothetical protein
MGASLWCHFGPYDLDLKVAFLKTCEQVFRERDYLKGLPEDPRTIDEPSEILIFGATGD